MIDPDALSDAATDLEMLLGGGRSTQVPDESPSRIAFGTVVRAAPIDKGGELVVLDWERKQVEASIPIRPRNPSVKHDPNPRGNARGCRGIRWQGGHLVAATYHTLELYDDQLTHTDALQDGLMVGLHEIQTTDTGTVWVSATAIDAALEYDLATGERRRALWPREHPALQEALGLRPLDLDKSADNRLQFLDPSHADAHSHLHLNAVDMHDGAVYGLCNAHAAIVNLTAGTVSVQHDALQGGHNLHITPSGQVLTNDTFGRAVCLFDLNRGTLRRRIDLTTYQWVRRHVRHTIPGYWARKVAQKIGWRDSTVARPLFVRGLARYGNTLLIGVSPAAILQVDLRSGALVDAYRYSESVHACIHGLAVMERT